jgi:hypothetical protein
MNVRFVGLRSFQGTPYRFVVLQGRIALRRVFRPGTVLCGSTFLLPLFSARALASKCPVNFADYRLASRPPLCGGIWHCGRTPARELPVRTWRATA